MQTVPQLIENELVNVSIRGARVAEVDRTLDGSPVVELVTSHVLRLPLAMRGVTVERVAPAEWPPQAGDVWRDRDGRKWFVRYVDGEPYMVSTTEDNGSPEYVLDEHGPMTLHDREGWTPTTDTAPAAHTPEQLDERAEVIAGLRRLLDVIEAHPELTRLPRWINWQTRTAEEQAAWIAALGGAAVEDHPHGNTIQHWAKAKLRGLHLDVTWIENLPPAAEPLPARVPAGVLEISRSIELVEPDTRLSYDEALADAEKHGHLPLVIASCLSAFDTEVLCPNNAVPGKHFCQPCIDSGRAAQAAAADPLLDGAL
jgi:hypothetical protein